MTLPGISGPTKRVGKHGEEVRVDGWGTMTDEEVAEYKEVRFSRYVEYQYYELAKRVTALEALEEPPEPPEEA